MYKHTEITLRTRQITYNTSSTSLDDFMNLATDTDSQYKNTNNQSNQRVQTREQRGNKTHNYNYNKNITINNYVGNSNSNSGGGNNNKHNPKNSNHNNRQQKLKYNSSDRKQTKPYLKIDSSDDITYFKIINSDLSPINMSFSEFIVNKKFWNYELKAYFNNNVDISRPNQISVFVNNLKNVINEISKLTKHINNTMNSFNESGHRHNQNIIKLKDDGFYINSVKNDNDSYDNNHNHNHNHGHTINNDRRHNNRNTNTNNYRGQQSSEYMIYFELGNNIVHFIMTNKKTNKSISISRGSYDKNVRVWNKCSKYFNKYANRNQSSVAHFWENLEYTVESHSHLGNYVYNLMNTFK
jgi:hypothetical protein